MCIAVAVTVFKDVIAECECFDLVHNQAKSSLDSGVEIGGPDTVPWT